MATRSVIVSTANNIAVAVKAAFDGIVLGTHLNLTATELLFRRLGKEQEFKSLADSAAKKTKKLLVEAGAIATEYPEATTQVIYDGDTVVVTADTKSGTKRLDIDILRSLLKSAGLSEAKISSALTGSYVDNKPATSIKVAYK